MKIGNIFARVVKYDVIKHFAASVVAAAFCCFINVTTEKC